MLTFQVRQGRSKGSRRRVRGKSERQWGSHNESWSTTCCQDRATHAARAESAAETLARIAWSSAPGSCSMAQIHNRVTCFRSGDPSTCTVTMDVRNCEEMIVGYRKRRWRWWRWWRCRLAAFLLCLPLAPAYQVDDHRHFSHPHYHSGRFRRLVILLKLTGKQKSDR